MAGVAGPGKVMALACGFVVAAAGARLEQSAREVAALAGAGAGTEVEAAHPHGSGAMAAEAEAVPVEVEVAEAEAKAEAVEEAVEEEACANCRCGSLSHRRASLAPLASTSRPALGPPSASSIGGGMARRRRKRTSPQSSAKCQSTNPPTIRGSSIW